MLVPKTAAEPSATDNKTRFAFMDLLHPRDTGLRSLICNRVMQLTPLEWRRLKTMLTDFFWQRAGDAGQHVAPAFRLRLRRRNGVGRPSLDAGCRRGAV